MEGSSPLAFARPAPLPSAWNFHNEQSYNPNLLNPAYVAPSFNFQSMASRGRKPDYFSCKAVRDSSPASALAVDLAQNLQVDQSPQLPTPRRSLFSGAMIDLGLRPAAITPPIPSSSPGPDSDPMDCTPLPHKRPHQPPVFQIDTCPTPDITPDLDETPAEPPSSVLSSVPLVRCFSQPVQSLATHENERIRSRPQFLAPRPQLKKNFSSTTVPLRQTSLQAPFQFSSSSRVPTLESFAESPVVDRGPATAPLRPSIPMMLNLAGNGSPSQPIPRPQSRHGRRLGFRRTQSMQVAPSTKPMRQEKRSCTDSSRASSVSLEMDDGHKPRLPHFMSSEGGDDIPRLTHETFVDVLNGVYNENGEAPLIVDCRFEYEYDGGHITSALNFNDREECARKLFNGLVSGGRTLIFHCEYSRHRAPLMAQFIRQRDRTINAEHYPRLHFPEVYILDGGYSAFFKAHPTHCFPQAYVEMEAEEHEIACERGLAQIKRPRAKLCRAQTYAFGQGQNALAVPRIGGAATAAPALTQQRTNFNLDLGGLPAFSGSPIGLGSMADVPRGSLLSPSLDAMDIDFSSPAQLASTMLHRGLARRLDTY